MQDEISLTKNLVADRGLQVRAQRLYRLRESNPAPNWCGRPTRAIPFGHPPRKPSGSHPISIADCRRSRAIVPLPQGAFGLVTVFGNPNTKVEQLRDFETGYRAQINRRLSLDVTGFLSFYQNLETSEPQTPYFTPHAGASSPGDSLDLRLQGARAKLWSRGVCHLECDGSLETQPRLDHAEHVRHRAIRRARIRPSSR